MVKRKDNRHDIPYYIATLFGIGNIPFFPGTCASLAGTGLFLLISGNAILYHYVFAVLFAVGVIVSQTVESRLRTKDPSFIVIDEFACVLPVFFFVPVTAFNIVLGFILFRVFDISKLPPVRNLEKIPGGWGIMLDDLAAALYTNLTLQIIIFISGKF